MLQVLQKFGVVVMAGYLLAACAIYNSSPQMPSRADIIPGETITVDGKKNIYAVAHEHNVSMRELIVLNNLQAPFTLRPGQTLTLPAGSNPQTVGISSSPYAAPPNTVERVPLAPVEPAPVLATPLVPPPSKLEPKPTMVETLNKPTPPARTVTTTATAKPEPIAPSSSSSSPPPKIEMVWPVQGPILSSFGPKGQGLNNDGINIGAPKDAPVVAAANGIVVYAGNEMKGFGNLILIRHQDGWVTAYAHLGRMLVNKDAVVAQGDMIGTVGKTGNVPSPQLHFETRYQGKSVDPAGIIKG